MGIDHLRKPPVSSESSGALAVEEGEGQMGGKSGKIA